MDPITLLVGGGIGLISAFAANRLSALAEKRKQTSISIVMLKSERSKDLSQFVTLYNDLIEEAIRVDADEMIHWLSKDETTPRKHTYCPYLLLAKQGGQVIGFLKMILLPKKKSAFIAYIGVDGPRGTQSEASVKLVSRALKVIRQQLGQTVPIFCEVQAPGAAPDTAERGRRKARIHRFRSIARQLGTDLYEVDLDIKQPDLHFSGGTEEIFRLLISFGVSDGRHRKEIPLTELTPLIATLYDDVYATTFRHDTENKNRFTAYCSSLLSASLPDTEAIKLL